MWRRSLHDELGYFDESLECAADWDFWIRISARYRFEHIHEPLGLYYHNESGVEHTRKIHNLYERYIVGKRYGTEYIAVIPYCQVEDDHPLVSIIMPAYNRSDYISEAIESVLIQNYPKFELVIVDDGSTDNTKEIIHSYKDERIRYFYKENGGPSSARNYALQKARAEYIIPLDSDDMIAPNYILSHLQHLSNHPDADLIYCDDQLIDEASRPIRVMEHREYSDRKEHIRDMFRAGHSVIPFRTFIKRTVFEKIGGYDEGLMIGEDFDLMRRFVKAGLKMVHLNETLYMRRMQTGSQSRSASINKAKNHFDVIGRVVDTFTCEELFPNINWNAIPPQSRRLNAKCLIGATYFSIGDIYRQTQQPTMASVAFERGREVLTEYLRTAPDNPKVREILQQCENALQLVSS
jgi:glycosyltransferase involved in cell wall biosynthesis